MSAPGDQPMHDDDASDMEEVIDMENLKELEEAGMVQFHDDGNEPPPEDNETDMGGDEAPIGDEEEDEEEEEPLPEMATQIFGGHTKPVHCVAIHAKENIIASGGEDDKVFLWKADTSRRTVIPPATEENDFMTKPFAELSGHTDTVISVSFSADATLLATAGMDGRVILWDSTTGEQKAVMEDLGDAISYMFWHPKGNVVFAGSADSQSAMWNDKGVCLQVFAGHASEVTCGALVSENKLLATGSDDQAVKVFSPKTGEQVAHFDSRGKGMHTLPACAVTAVAAHPRNADCIVAGYEDGTVALLAISAKKVFSAHQGVHTSAIEFISPSPLLPYFTTCCAGEGILVFWNAENNTIRDQVKQDAGFTATRWMGEHLYATDTDGAVHCFDGRSASAVLAKRWTGHVNTTLCLDVHPDCWVVSGSDDTTLRMFQPDVA